MEYNTKENFSEPSRSYEQFNLFLIAINMRNTGLPDVFIVESVRVALKFEGVADLMNLWQEEGDDKERRKIIEDIQNMIDACSS